MDIIPMLQKELEQEAFTTRKMLQRIPENKYDWKPHEKSMSVRRLATHIAELPTWIGMALNTSGLDFASSPYEPTPIHNNEELMICFEKSLEDGRHQLSEAKENQLTDNWSLRNGEQVLYTATKGEVIRMAYCQIVHHRAQLGVFLRLLNIPIPGSYGPSADEQ